VVTYHPVEMREVFIEILPVGDESRVITVIEVLSPATRLLAARDGNYTSPSNRNSLKAKHT